MVKSKRAQEATQTDVPAAPIASDPKAEKTEKKLKKRKRDDQDESAVALPSDHDASKAKKAKKDKKDKKSSKYGKESRKDKKDKLKDLQDLPEDADSEDEQADATTGTETPEEQAKEERRARKKEKRDKKKQKQATVAPAANGDAQDPPAVSGTKSANGDPIDLNGEEDQQGASAEKKDRHIVFVGNLPFSATAASITAHFASLSPIAVRCLKNKGDANPCKGIAFVEFGEVWQQRTCLDKFHHSEFNDGVSATRKINVELTAGGGGKTKQRREKIKAKNAKLEENRTKRIAREKTAKSEAQASQAHQEESMHPSRRARI